MRINILSVFCGFLGGIIGIALFEVLVWEVASVYIRIPLALSDFLYSNSGTVLIDSLGLFLAMVLGGYITGRIAKVNALYNGFTMGFFAVAVSVLLTALDASTSAYLNIEYTLSHVENIQFLLDMVMSVTGAMIGAHLSARRNA